MADSTTKIILSADDKTKSAFDSVGRNLDNMAGSLVNINGLMAGLSVGALTATIKASTDSADAASKNAQKVGMLTEEWTRLEYAAGMSDVATEKLMMGLTNLSSKAFTAATAGGASAEAFSKLGISATDSEGRVRDSGDLFTEITDKLSKMEDGSTKSALAAEFFGKKVASELIPMINSGTAGLADMANEADRLGVTISGETGLAAEQFNDNLTRMSKAGEGAANTFTAALLPTLNVVAESLLGTSKNSDVLALATDGAKVALQTISIIGANVAYVFKGVGNELGGVAAQMMAIASGDFSGAAQIGEIIKEDARIAREELDALEKRIMNPPAPAAAAERRAEAPVYDSSEKIKALQKESDAVEKYNQRLVEKYIEWDAKEYDRQQKQHEKLAADNQAYFASLSNAAFEVAATDEEIIQRRHDAEVSALETRRMIAATDHELTLEEIEQFEQAKADIFFKYESGRVEDRENSDKKIVDGQTRYQKISLDSMGAFFGMTKGMMNSNSRAMFEIGKASAISETVINTYKSATGAYSALASIPYAGPYLGAAAAAAAIVAGLAQVSAIQSTSFGSGGGAGATYGGANSAQSGGQATTYYPSSPTNQQAPQQQQVSVTIYNTGNVQTSEFADQMVTQIRDKISNSDVILIDPRSRQASMLAGNAA